MWHRRVLTSISPTPAAAPIAIALYSHGIPVHHLRHLNSSIRPVPAGRRSVLINLFKGIPVLEIAAGLAYGIGMLTSALILAIICCFLHHLSLITKDVSDTVPARCS